MITRDLLTRFEAIVRRNLPRATLGAALVVSTAACSGPDADRYRGDPSMESYTERAFQPLEDADFAALVEVYETRRGELLKTCQTLCTENRGPLTGCEPGEEEGKKGVVCAFTYTFMRPVGRKPPGLAEAVPAQDSDEVGRWFADCARMEEAAVFAFAGLLDELSAHGAPAELQQACLQAIADEIQHTHATRAMARAHGAAPERPECPPLAIRPLLDIALDNAVEGCVNETYAALQATWQAHAAPEGPVRDVLARIAEDETRHAEFSWALDDWLQTQLDESARAQVIEARGAALAELEAHLARGEGVAPAALGLPNSAQATALLGAMMA